MWDLIVGADGAYLNLRYSDGVKRKELIRLGFGHRKLADLAIEAVKSASRAGLKKPALRRLLKDLVENPALFETDEHFAELAAGVTEHRQVAAAYVPRREKAPYRRWGARYRSRSRSPDGKCVQPAGGSGWGSDA